MKPTGTIVTNLNSSSNGGSTPRLNGLPRYITLRSDGDTNALLNGDGDQCVALLTADLNIVTDDYQPPINMNHNGYLSNQALFPHLMHYIYMRNFVAPYQH